LSLLKHINLRNFRTLYKALWTESPQQIYTNLKKLIKDIPDEASVACRLMDQSEADIEGELPVSIDLAFLVDQDILFIQGWAAGREIPDLEITDADDKIIWKGKPFLKRKDVRAIFPSKDFDKKSGLILVLRSKLKDNNLFIKSTNSEGAWTKYAFNVHPVDNINKVDLARHDQYNIIQALAPLLPKKKAKDLSYEPLISIVVPVYNVAPKWLKKMVASVKAQSYKNWELCLSDDKSTSEKTINALKKYEGQKGIKIAWNAENQNISAATNEAIRIASGEFIGFMDNDDELHRDALYEVVKALNEDRNIKVIYTDEDKISLEGRYVEPYHKYSFCIDTLRSNNYMSHFSVVEKKLGDSVGWLRVGYEGAQDHDLMLRLSEKTSSIHHIPKILYHWRKIEGSTAMSHDQKGYAQKAGEKAVKSHLKRSKIKAKVKKGKWPGAYLPVYETDTNKRISIIIPFKDEVEMLKDCILSIIKKTSYANYDILLVSNNSEENKTFKFLDSICKKHEHIRYVEHNVPFNYAEINNWAVSQVDTQSEYILFLNNDITVINKGWLSSMAQHIQREKIGAVGAKLLYPDGTIQHAGVVLGIGGVAGHAFKGLAGHLSHYYMDNIIRGISACTAACLLVKRNVFSEVGGFDEANLKVAFNDVDLCLKIREAGYKLIYTPYAELYHYESKSRGYEDTIEKINRFKKEESFMKNKWAEMLTSDPYYSPNLSLTRQQYQLDLQSRINEYLDI